ncbi:unnamed protein product [Caenorhabditis brenneri]
MSIHNLRSVTNSKSKYKPTRKPYCKKRSKRSESMKIASTTSGNYEVCMSSCEMSGHQRFSFREIHLKRIGEQKPSWRVESQMEGKMSSHGPD